MGTAGPVTWDTMAIYARVFGANNNNDTIYGGDWHDVLIGSRGDDFLYGDGGDDILIGDWAQSVAFNDTDLVWGQSFD